MLILYKHAFGGVLQVRAGGDQLQRLEKGELETVNSAYVVLRAVAAYAAPIATVGVAPWVGGG